MLRLAGAALALSATSAAHAACDDLLPSAGAGRGPMRLARAEDLLAMRDIGFPDPAGAPPESPLAISPDGKRIAFVITRADLDTNGYCRGLAVLELAPGARPRLLDRGGDYLPIMATVRGLLLNIGASEVVTPLWSPDGRSVAYRKRVDGRTEAWIAAADGSGARRVARLATDIEALAWSIDGQRVVLASRPGLADQRRALAREAASGFLYDDRYQPNDDSRPALSSDSPVLAQSLELTSGRLTGAGPEDRGRLPPEFAAGLPAELSATAPSGRRAWLEPELKVLASPMVVHAIDDRGKAIACSAPACRGAIDFLAWRGGEVVFLRREGWARETYALYRWHPGTDAPRPIFATRDTVHGCASGSGTLVCLAEDSVTPRRLVRIDIATGRRDTLFDPNPEFGALRLGAVRRLQIRNSFGLEAWADLVLPPGYRGGRLPTVVVQYYSRGFLRGAGGDESPIQALAARGFAVLSIQRPPPVAVLDPSSTTDERLTAGGTRAWADRRSLQEVIDKAIDEAIRLGVTDPARIGITGQSDGASSSIFALINSGRIAAVSIASCCLEPNTMMTYGGPRWARFNAAIGYPALGVDDSAFWAPVSLSQAAPRVTAPILMQLADHEYLLSLEAWARLKQAQAPVEMYVFPDEYHNKWQPAHRLAAYLRNLDWFDYWLAGKRDPDPAKQGQYRRWDELRSQRDAKLAAGATHPASR